MYENETTWVVTCQNADEWREMNCNQQTRTLSGGTDCNEIFNPSVDAGVDGGS